MAVFAIVSIGSLAFVLSYSAHAQTSATTVTPAPEVVQVNADGSALIRGTVASTGAGSITINSWGGAWTIRTSNGNANVVPAGSGGASDMSALSVGDFVGAEGTVATDQPWTMDATVVRDWTTNPIVSVNTAPSGPLPPLTTPPLIKNPSMTVSGVVSNANNGTFTLTNANGNAYTVSTGSNAFMLNSNGDSLNSGDIQNGDAVTVTGVNTGGSVAAVTLSDMSR